MLGTNKVVVVVVVVVGLRSVHCSVKLSRSVRSPLVGFVYVVDKSFVI